MNNSFHNTTRESKSEVDKLENKASTQEEIILEIFYQNNGELLSASEIFDRYFDQTIPITSVRRALSNLYHQGMITKTNHKTNGLYGRPEVLWKNIN